MDLVNGTKRNAFVLTVLCAVTHMGLPEALMIPLGENDLPSQKGVDLTMAIIADLQDLHPQLPHTQFLWSELLKKHLWLGAAFPEKLDVAKKKVCKGVDHFVELVGGMVIPPAPHIGDFLQAVCFLQDRWCTLVLLESGLVAPQDS